MSAVTVYDGNFSFQTTPSIKLRRWPARGGGGGWLQRYYVWCELRWWPDLTDMMRCCTEWNKWLIILHIALNANGTFMTHIKQMVPHGMERERELWWQLAPLSFSTLLWGWVLTNGVAVTTETRCMFCHAAAYKISPHLCTGWVLSDKYPSCIHLLSAH